ncbi:MAG: PilZ domain-containing protein [Acidobacteriia bacterium]|nr:PilZ domain-containing protein [Terriglobia bacterium]
MLLGLAYEMALQSLLLSRDDDVIRVLRRVLNDLEIDVEVCTLPDKAAEQLARKKWDAIIIDCDDVHGALDVLRSVRLTTSNKTSTAFAIINGVTSVRSAFELGANLALEKPITADRAQRSFRAVHGMMVAERRLYYRHPVDLAVTLKYEDKNNHRHFEILATAINLSEGGMAVKLKSPPPDMKAVATLRFILPGTHNWIETPGTIAWFDGEGQGGIRFENPPFSVKEHLAHWFNQTMNPEKKPVPMPVKWRFWK